MYSFTFKHYQAIYKLSKQNPQRYCVLPPPFTNTFVKSLSLLPLFRSTGTTSARQISFQSWST